MGTVPKPKGRRLAPDSSKVTFDGVSHLEEDQRHDAEVMKLVFIIASVIIGNNQQWTDEK